MKPSLVYAILIAVVVVAAALFARSNSPVPENFGKPVASPSSEAIELETTTPEQDAASAVNPE